jgi:hypothetical protein
MEEHVIVDSSFSWDLVATKIDDETCEFTNAVQSCATPELLEFLGKQGTPLDVFPGCG